MRTILSVDDEPAILSTRQSILESAGYRVLSAPNGEAALRLFSSQPVDLVLLDYLMPGLDGGTVARKMKRRRPDVPVILVSASSVPEDVLRGVDWHCDKEAGPVSLLNKVSEFLVPSPDHQPNRKRTEDGAASRGERLSTSVPNSLPAPQQLSEKMSGALTCWKEIAQYFGKGVRTVQRWEHEAGLPIRRHNGSKGRVFALPQELAAWLQSATRGIQDQPESEVERLRKAVADLSLENETLRRRLAAIEEAVIARSQSDNAILQASSSEKGPSRHKRVS